MYLTPLSYLLHCSPQPLPCCADMDRKLPISASRTNVREPKEVEGRRFPLTLASQVLLGKSPEGEKPSLFLAQLQTIRGQPLPEHTGNALCVSSVLEADDEVISIPDEIHLTTQPRLHLFVHPRIEDIM